MVLGKKKKAARRKKRGNRFFMFFLPLFLACLFGLGLFLFLANSNTHYGPILYEEIYSSPSDLKDRIRQIDNNIYESFYANGLDDDDIMFSAVKPMHGNGHEWDFTELLVRLDGQSLTDRFGDRVAESLQELEPDVVYKKEELSSQEFVYHIYALGFYTHRLRFSPKIHVGHEKAYPMIAIVIDDLGHDRAMADAVMAIDLPLSLSILPMAPHTSYVAREAMENQRDTLLHLPMEPKGYPEFDPGPGALLMSMGNDAIRHRIDELVRQVPGISGVNNHMGSCFTESREKMEVVLQELRKQRLFYVDSRTTNRTVAYDVAREIGVPAAKKSLFLDHDISTKAISYQMERLMGLARYNGTAVGIGHPHKETIRVLRKYEKRLKADFQVIPVSELVGQMSQDYR